MDLTQAIKTLKDLSETMSDDEHDAITLVLNTLIKQRELLHQAKDICVRQAFSEDDLFSTSEKQFLEALVSL